MYRETEIVVILEPRHHDGPPELLECRKFYDHRHEPFDDTLARLVHERDHAGIKHLHTCEGCRMAIQMREIDSSPSYMDIQLDEAERTIS
jgi:hypothetical protein